MEIQRESEFTMLQKPWCQLNKSVSEVCGMPLYDEHMPCFHLLHALTVINMLSPPWSKC